MLRKDEMERKRQIVRDNWAENKNKNLPITSLAEECKVTPETYRKYLREVGINPIGRIFTYQCDRSFFHKIDTEEKAYWLGFLYADGNVFINEGWSYIMSLTLSKVDTEHVLKFKNALKCDIPHYFKETPNPANQKEHMPMVRLDISSKELCNDLISQGCTPQKSLTKQFPKKVPHNLLRHFFRGYIDGNGCITSTEKTKLELSISSCYSFLESFIKYIKNEIGIDIPAPSKFKAKNGMEWGVLSKTGNRAFQIIKFFYQDSKVYLNRKHAKWEYVRLKFGENGGNLAIRKARKHRGGA